MSHLKMVMHNFEDKSEEWKRKMGETKKKFEARLHTRQTREKIGKWIAEMDLLEHMSGFVDLHVIVESLPAEASKTDKADDWKYVTFVMQIKDDEPDLTLSKLAQIFLQGFPHSMQSVAEDEKSVIYQGDLDKQDMEIVKVLMKFIEARVAEGDKMYTEFEEKWPSTMNLIDLLVELAKKYDRKGGKWVFWFGSGVANDEIKRKVIFELLLNGFCGASMVEKSNAFNFKLDNARMFITFCNRFSVAAVDSRVMTDRMNNSFPNACKDPEVNALLHELDKLYDADILGDIQICYKLVVVSRCKVDKHGLLKPPTAYTRSYRQWYEKSLEHKIKSMKLVSKSAKDRTKSTKAMDDKNWRA